MKRKLMGLILLVSSVALSACGKQSNSTGVGETKNESESTTKEIIDLSQVDPKLIEYHPISVDMNVLDPTLDDMLQKADVIFKGTLTEVNSYVNKDTVGVQSDYVFHVNEMFKGEPVDMISINTIGGIMKKTDYISQMIQYGFAEEQQENNEGYAVFGIENMSTLNVNSEYIIFACLNERTGIYYPLYYYYGIFVENQDGTFSPAMENSEIGERLDLEKLK